MLHSSALQLLTGFCIGASSVVLPSLFKPLITAAFVFAVAQGVVLYHAGGTGAVLVGLTWLVGIVQTMLIGLAGLGIGCWAAGVITGR